MLRPLVRLLLSESVSYQQATELLKQVYVESAAHELTHHGHRPSTSRLSLLTGIRRKEVKRIREGPLGDDEVPEAVSLGAQLVARWTGDSPFVDEGGRPLPLVLTADAGSPSFHELVRSVTTDIHPRSVLDEWLRLGLVSLDDGERIHLVTAAFVPKQGFEEKTFYLGRNVRDHLAAAARNVVGEGPSTIERSVHYSRLTPEAVSELEEYAEQAGMRLLEDVNRRARKLAGKAAEGAPVAAERMNFGLYFFRGPSAPDD